MVEIISPWAIEIFAFPSRQYVQSVKAVIMTLKTPVASTEALILRKLLQVLMADLSSVIAKREYTGKVLTLSFRAVYFFASRFVLEEVQKHLDVCSIVPE